MNIVKLAVFFFSLVICCGWGVAQSPLHPRSNFHAGLHSGSPTLERAQRLEEESTDSHRACLDPYCARCATHLADYGHEYQYVAGPNQRQLWYPGTAGTVAIVTQRGYDQHGLPYRLRGNPASAIVSWEYLQTLNHAIKEQVNARNAVAIEEAAQDRVILLTQLLADAQEQLRLTKTAWEQIEPQGKSCSKTVSVRCTKTYKQFCTEMKASRCEVARQGMCPYCLAQAQYRFDQEYVADVEKELVSARKYLVQKSTTATEAVRIALLSKSDADKATRFLRIQYKPPKYQEVLAAKSVIEPLPENGKPLETNDE
jgi:hypothetical protein